MKPRAFGTAGGSSLVDRARMKLSTLRAEVARQADPHAMMAEIVAKIEKMPI